MKYSEIEQLIYVIKSSAKHDDEKAHIYEDKLRDDFIAYIAERDDVLGNKARLILSTNAINFTRWCA